MGLTNIRIVPQDGNNTVTAINCGTSVPRLGGTIDLSAFSNLQNFRCVSNDITSVTGYENNSNLVSFVVSDNKLTGSIPALSAFTNITTLQYNSNLLTGPIPALSALKQCEILSFSNNQLTGPIPSLSGLANLLFFYCQDQTGAKLTGPIPELSGSPLLKQFFCSGNNLSGPIPQLSSLTNLTEFKCDSNDLTGSIPSLSGLRDLQYFACGNNLLTGSIPSLSGLISLRVFQCNTNNLTGPIPALSALSSLQFLQVHSNNLTGSIPALSGLRFLQNFSCASNNLTGPLPNMVSLTALQDFYCNNNLLTGPIPALSALSSLRVFNAQNNQFTGFAGGSVSNTCGVFEAQNNQLNQNGVNAILSAFDATIRTTGTRSLFLQAGTNAAPSYTGGVTTTSAGTNFSRTGTLVTANVTGHGHPNGSLVTISGIAETAFQGTFVITVVNANQFQYTTQTSGTVAGTGTATMRRTTVATDGFRYYQNLALVTRLGGFPWNVNINFP